MSNVQTYPVSVGTSATLIQQGPLPFAAPGSACVVVSNLGPTNTVYLGGAGVTASSGIPLAAGASLVLPGASLQNLYGIAATAGVTVVIGVF